MQQPLFYANKAYYDIGMTFDALLEKRNNAVLVSNWDIKTKSSLESEYGPLRDRLKKGFDVWNIKRIYDFNKTIGLVVLFEKIIVSITRHL